MYIFGMSYGLMTDLGLTRFSVFFRLYTLHRGSAASRLSPHSTVSHYHIKKCVDGGLYFFQVVLSPPFLE